MPYLTKAVPNPEPVDCRILTAALELFVAHGFHSVSVHDIQKLANVSIGSIYNHFGGKEGIAKALYDHLLIEIEQMIDQVLVERNCGKERCERVIELLFQYTETRRGIITFVFDIRHREILPQQASIYQSLAFKMLDKLIQQGMDEQDIKEGNLALISGSFFGAAIRMIQMRLEGAIEKPLNDQYCEIIELLWQGVAKKND